MSEEHYSLREMEKKKRELSGDTSAGPAYQRRRGYFSDKAFEDEEGINVRSYLDIIFHRKWVVLLITLVVMFSALYNSFSKKAFYKAHSQILYKEEDRSIIASLTGDLGIRSSRAPSMETLAAVSKTTPLLKKVIEKLPFELTTGELFGMIEVTPNIDTDILHITVTASESEPALVVANTFVNTFIEYQLNIIKRKQVRLMKY